MQGLVLQGIASYPRTDLLEDGLVGSPCSPRDSQESSPAPHFKSISFSTLSLLYSPILTSVIDYWKSFPLSWDEDDPPHLVDEGCVSLLSHSSPSSTQSTFFN